MEKSLGKLYIRKRTVPEWLVAFVFFLPFFQALFFELLGVPDVIKFSADAALMILLLIIFSISKKVKIGKHFSLFLVIIWVFFAYVTVVYFLNYQSVFYYLWGLRNYFRFYIAFIAFAIFVKWDEAQKWLNFLDKLYVVNFVVVVGQFIIGFRQDYLGGIFGVQKGCNGGLLIFITIVITRSILSFMRNEISTAKCLIFSAMGLLIASFAELKFFFVIFICIVIMAAVMTRNSVKKTLFFVLCAVLIIIFSTALTLMYDEFSGFLSVERLWNALINPNYATKEDIGRFTAIPTISKLFLPNFTDKLTGIGLGNGDTSSLALFNTPFFDIYGSLHYAIFSYSFLYLETGIIGLTIYVLFFVTAFVVALRFYKTKRSNELICQLAMIFSVICLMLVVYNGALRSEMAAYLAYFVLALPLIAAESSEYEKRLQIQV